MIWRRLRPIIGDSKWPRCPLGLGNRGGSVKFYSQLQYYPQHKPSYVRTGSFGLPVGDTFFAFLFSV